MAKFPSKPQHGKSFVQEFGNSINQIIDYLPSLEVRGDQKSTYVTKSSKGTVIHATEQNPSTKGKEYFAGSGLTLSGNTFNNAVTSGRFIEVTSAYAINCTLSGGRDIQITQGGIINYTGSGGGGASGYTYTGDGDLGSGHIFVDYSYTDPVICSNLRYIDDLLNYPISGDSIGSELHFAQIRDIKDGAGTQVDYHWTSIGDSTEEGGQLIKFIDGVCVNLNVSGGTYITTKFHQGVGYGDYTSASIDCNLSGTYNWYPHTSGFIAIVPQYDLDQNITGGIISTNLHAGSGIAIDPQTGEITCTIEGGGGSGGGNTYYADNFTLSTTSPTGNTFYLYDVYPLLTGRGGITVDRYGDSPLYPGYALGTVISCPVYLPSTGIAIIDDPTPGTQNKYVAITADFDYHAGTGISIDPATRTINCTVEPGGGGETYYADESTIKLSSTNNTFYLYDVEPLLTGAGGIKVYNYGLDGLSRRVTGISATPYTGGDNISVDNYVISMTATIPTKTSDLTNDSHFITINDVPPGSVYQGDNVTIAASGTNNNIFYVIDGVFAPLTTVVNLSTELSGHIDYVSSHFPLSTSELVNDVPFVTSTDLDDYYKWNAFEAVGDHLQYVPRLGRLNCTLTGGDWIQIDSNDQINCTLTNVSDLNNDAGYITISDVPQKNYYADNSTLSCSDNTFYVLNISSLLTGDGGTTVYHYGIGLSGQEIVGISSLNYQGGNGIQITPVEGQGGVATTYASIGLSSQFYNDLTTISTRPATGDKILSSHNGTLSWETNNASSPTWTSLTPSLLSVDNNNHTLSAATQSGGGGGGGGGGNFDWPHWENMCGSGHLVYVQQWYTTQDGGWLRISNKEDTTYGGCNSLYIDPVVPPAGVEGKNHIGLGTGRVSFFIPVPPGSSFWIGLNQGAQCWFDGTTTPPTHTTEDAILPQQIRDNSLSAVEACSVASSKCSEAESNADAMKNDYEGYVGQDNLYDPQWYKDHYYATIDNSNEATAAKNSCISYANACQTAYNSYDRPDKANYTQYVTDANNAVTDATSYATSAATQIDVASQYYDLAYDYWQAHHPQWFVDNPDYTKYNQ